MKSKICVSAILLILIIVCVSACRKAGKWLVKEDNLVHVDAIVVLMGSISDRALQAADLYRQKVTGKVLIVGPGMHASSGFETRGTHTLSNSESSHRALVAMGLPSDSIIILPGYVTRNTLTEAIIIRKYLVNNPGIDTLLLVSSSDHTRRASMIFKSVFNGAEQPVKILCSPSRYTSFDAEKWWRSRNGIQTVCLEYLKMANFFLFDRMLINTL